MSQNVPDHSSPSSMEHDAHRDAHVHGLRLVLGSIIAPKRPSPPSQTGSYPVSGTASPFLHWHHPGTPGSGGSGSGHDSPPLPSPQPNSSPVMPLYHPHYPQPPYQHAHHQPTPTPHPHLNAHSHVHAHPQPQSHVHAHAYGPSRLSFTHSTSSTPPESLSPSPSPSPRLATPPPMLDHAPHAYPYEAAGGDSGVNKTATAANPDATADQKRAHFIKTLQSKSAWDAMIHGSWV